MESFDKRLWERKREFTTSDRSGKRRTAGDPGSNMASQRFSQRVALRAESFPWFFFFLGKVCGRKRDEEKEERFFGGVVVRRGSSTVFDLSQRMVRSKDRKREGDGCSVVMTKAFFARGREIIPSEGGLEGNAVSSSQFQCNVSLETSSELVRSSFSLMLLKKKREERGERETKLFLHQIYLTPIFSLSPPRTTSILFLDPRKKEMGGKHQPDFWTVWCEEEGEEKRAECEKFFRGKQPLISQKLRRKNKTEFQYIGGLERTFPINACWDFFFVVSFLLLTDQKRKAAATANSDLKIGFSGEKNYKKTKVLIVSWERKSLENFFT